MQAYLQRIEFEGIPKNDFATLRHLQFQHLITVPYENLDIMRDIPISLKIEDVYKKVVERGRGGYCFELNGLFAWLLRSLGFTVAEHMARYLRGEQEIPMRRHRVLKVTCVDGDYLCDVGVGDTIPLVPLPIKYGVVNQQKMERYKLENEPFLGNVLYEWKKNEWRKIYSFTEEKQLNIDYIMPSFYCEKHPDSYFRTMDMVHIFTKDGRKTVAGREIKLFSPNHVNVIVAGTEAAFKELLEVHFKIRI